MLEDPLSNIIRDKFQYLFKNVVWGSLKSSFNWDHQIDVSLYFTQAIAFRHLRKLAGFTPSSCTLIPVSLLTSGI